MRKEKKLGFLNIFIPLIIFIVSFLSVPADVNALFQVKEKSGIKADEISQKKAAVIREIIKDDIENTKKEKKRIIDRSKEQIRPKKKRPFEATETIYYEEPEEKPANASLKDKVTVITAEWPFLLLFFVFILLCLLYMLHVHGKERK